jgi:multidrug efflux pump subunit AcrB
MIALAAKNAILIVEFARELKAEGMSTVDAAVEATRRRFRPILMTSIAFILGVVPLLTATGAGAASQQSLANGAVRESRSNERGQKSPSLRVPTNRRKGLLKTSSG